MAASATTPAPTSSPCRHWPSFPKSGGAREPSEMPVNRPPLLRLGGEEAFAAYQREFDRLYRSGPVVDVLGNRVSFPSDACRSGDPILDAQPGYLLEIGEVM